MDPNQIEDAIKHAENKGLNTRAIIPVDLFGFQHDIVLFLS